MRTFQVLDWASTQASVLPSLPTYSESCVWALPSGKSLESLSGGRPAAVLCPHPPHTSLQGRIQQWIRRRPEVNHNPGNYLLYTEEPTSQGIVGSVHKQVQALFCLDFCF